MNRMQALLEQGQSVWLDFISREIIENGELAGLVENGLRGLTSNPTIFEKAIAGGADYDARLRELSRAGQHTEEIYEALAVADIQDAADLLRPVFEASKGADGFVSLEVSPHIAGDTEKTASEARRLRSLVDRPNLLVKVPATEAGIPAIETLISEGASVNATLIFSLEQYDAVAAAYISGLEKLVAGGGDASKVASVASFFVSRVDGKVDAALKEKGNAELAGKIAVANAKVAYARFADMFAGGRWEKLADRGARVQRPLWASTSAKNPDYSDVMYVEPLIGPHTVNTLPPATLKAVMDHAEVRRTIDQGVDEACAQVAALEKLGVDLDAITDALLVEGVGKFAASFDALLASVEEKRKKLAAS